MNEKNNQDVENNLNSYIINQNKEWRKWKIKNNQYPVLD